LHAVLGSDSTEGRGTSSPGPGAVPHEIQFKEPDEEDDDDDEEDEGEKGGIHNIASAKAAAVHDALTLSVHVGQVPMAADKNGGGITGLGRRSRNNSNNSLITNSSNYSGERSSDNLKDYDIPIHK